MSPSNYPGGLDAFATSGLNGTIVGATDHQNKGDALNKIETELGTDPSGSHTDVKTRLNVIEASAGSPAGYFPVASPYGRTEWNAAITAANVASSSGYGGIVTAPPGSFTISGAGALTTLTNCLGILGHPGGTQLVFNTDSDCIIAKGNYKQIKGLYINNNITNTTSQTYGLRIKNCVNGVFEEIQVQTDGTNGGGIILEQVYEGVSADGNLLAHGGCWENTFRNCSTNYGANGSTFGNVGIGISLAVNANAVGVVNPLGADPGTYTGSVKHTTVINHNSEGKLKGINLDRASCNMVIGGHFIGCTDQIFGTNANANTFHGVQHNQWSTRPYNLATASCFSNGFFSLSLSHPGIGTPWSMGIIGTRPIGLNTDEGIAEHGLILNELRVARSTSNAIHFDTTGTTMDLQKPDNTGAVFRWKDTPPHQFFGEVEFWNPAGSNQFVKIDSLNGCLELKEAGQANGPANTGRLFTEDNGSGKTQLKVRFATGGAITLATEP